MLSLKKTVELSRLTGPLYCPKPILHLPRTHFDTLRQQRCIHTTLPLRDLEWRKIAKKLGKRELNQVEKEEKRGMRYQTIDPPVPFEGAADSTEQPVFTFSPVGACRSTYINNQHRLNALSYEVLDKLHQLILKWSEDSITTAVTIRGAGDIAFSTGMDFKDLLLLVRSGNIQGALDYLGKEYSVLHSLVTSAKPILGVCNGLTVGSGAAGLIFHSPIPITTDKACVSLPETGLGFFPGSGVTYYLAMLSPGMGNYLAMTGAALESADLRDLSLAMFFCTTDGLQLVEERLGMTFGTQIKRVFDALMETVSWDRIKFSLEDDRQAIERCFAQPTVEKIFEALEAENTKWSNETLATMKSKCPLSLKVTFRLLQEQRKAPTFESFQDREENFTKLSKKDLLQILHNRLHSLTLDEAILEVGEGPDHPEGIDLIRSVSSSLPTPKYLLREKAMQKLLDTLGVKSHGDQLITEDQFNQLAADYAATRRVDEISSIPLPMPSPSLRNIAYTLAALFGEEMEIVLARDYLIAQRFFTTPDFLEGLTAFEEQRTPRWSHKSVSEVTDEEVERFFRPPSTSESPLLFSRQAVGIPLKSWVRMEWERVQLELAPFDHYLQVFRNNHLSAVSDMIFYHKVMDNLYELETEEFEETYNNFEEVDETEEGGEGMEEVEEGMAMEEEPENEEDEIYQRAVEMAQQMIPKSGVELSEEEYEALRDNPQLLERALAIEFTRFDPSVRFVVHRSKDLKDENHKALNYLRHEWYVRKFKEMILDVIRTPYADPNDSLPIKQMTAAETAHTHMKMRAKKVRDLTPEEDQLLVDLEPEKREFFVDTIASKTWLKQTGNFFLEDFKALDVEAPPQTEYDDLSLDQLAPKRPPSEEAEEEEGEENPLEQSPDRVLDRFLDEEVDVEEGDEVIDTNPAYPQDELEETFAYDVAAVEDEEEGDEAGYLPEEEFLIKERRDAEDQAEIKDIQELNVDDDYDLEEDENDDEQENTLHGIYQEQNDESQEVEYNDSDDEDQEIDEETFNSDEEGPDEDPEDESRPLHIIHRPSPEDVRRHKALPYGFNHPEDQPL